MNKKFHAGDPKRADLRLRYFTHASIFPFLLSFLICSCQKNDGLPGSSGRIDVVAFVAAEVARYGGLDRRASVPGTNTPIKYTYERDADGCQVFCKGDRTRELASCLNGIFGQPFLSATNAGGFPYFQYRINQTGSSLVGVALSVAADGWQSGDSNKIITQVVIVRAGALK